MTNESKKNLEKLLSALRDMDGVEVEEIHTCGHDRPDTCKPDPHDGCDKCSHANGFTQIAQDTKECYEAFCKAGFDDTRSWSMTRMVMSHILDAVTTEED